MAVKNFAQLMDLARQRGPKTVAVAAAAQEAVLLAVNEAEELGIANVILVGDRAETERIGRENGVDLSRLDIIHQPDPMEAARQTMQLINEGRAQIAMKGAIQTADFLRAALDRKFGVRGGRLISHVAAFDIPGMNRLLLVSDAGVVVAPGLQEKADIVRNAIAVAHRLGIGQPRVALLAATEVVNPKIPATVDAAALSKMADRKQIVGGIVDGPLTLDNAISEEAAAIKGIESPVAGRADILIAPDIEAGNILAKGIIYFAQAYMAGIIVGARAPIILPSRSDTHEAKLVALAMCVTIA
ncbi:MAG: bifunctional enoyl-CoA hydratase/phosphate acetyltransferase [Chloroflexota bacterium]